MIFINYRKHDTQQTVDHLAERLKLAFGADHVFKDDADLQGGDVWPDRLRDALARARVLVTVIGPNWLKTYDEHGRRRIDDPADWVREEICTALRDGKTVLVVLADGAPGLARGALPSGCELEKLPDIQKVELRKGTGRNQDLTDLTRLLARLADLPLPAEVVPSPSVDVTPLPRLPTVFFGRDKELAELRAQVVPADTSGPLPKLPIIGIGGMGKSTLAAALLWDSAVVERYGERRHFAKLEGADGLPLLLERLASALGVLPGVGLANRIVAGAGIGGLRLLVLDNLETPLQDEVQRPDVRDFLEQLAAVPTLAVVATLRPGCPLGAGWKRPLELLPYDLDAARSTFHTLSNEAYLGDPDLDGLLTELEGWPIAVTLLSWRVGAYRRAKDLAEAWRAEHSALLVSGSTRHDADLGACVGLSLADKRMTDGARRLLGLLALSPDGIDQDDMNELLPGMGNRAAATLREVGGLTTDGHYRLKDRERTRMWMPAPLRDYVGIKHPASDDDRDRWVRLYCRRVDKQTDLIGGEKGGDAMARIRAEVSNMAEAVRLALAGDLGIPACVGAISLGVYGGQQGIDFRGLLMQALAIARRWPNQPYYTNCLFHLAQAAGTWGDVDEAGAWIRRYAGAIADLEVRIGEKLASVGRRQRKVVGSTVKAGIAVGRATYEEMAGEFALGTGDHRSARSHLDRALLLYQESASRTGQGTVSATLGVLAMERAEYSMALAYLEQGRELLESEGRVGGVGECIRAIGEVKFKQGELADAARYFQEALTRCRQGGNLLGVPFCILNLGQVDLARGDMDLAADRFAEALKGGVQLNHFHLRGEALQCLGDLALARGRPDEARGHYEDALRAFRHIKGRPCIGQAHQRLARVAPDSAERAKHIRLARQDWAPLELPHLIKELDDEFGPEPTPT